MGYRLTYTTSTVDITRGTVRTNGTMSGTANLQVLDTSTDPATVVSSPSIAASGSISQNGSAVDAGSRSGFTLDVTWNTSGSATSSAAGNYGGSPLSCSSIPVSVDGGGIRRRKGKGVLKPVPRRKPAAARKPATRKTSASARKTAQGRKRAPGRKTASARR